MSTLQLSLYKIDPDYIRFMHSVDYRVSVKFNNRPFVGVITMVNGINYVIPLTSQTTEERKKEGKNKRSSEITTFIRDSKNNEIANLLHNNMFPVVDGAYSLVDIDVEKNTYELNEIRYIRKHSDEIAIKAQKVYTNRTKQNNQFLNKTCCDFKKLESKLIDYKRPEPH